MPTKRARPDTTLKPRTLKIADDELEIIQRAAEKKGVSVSYLLRAAGTAVASNPEWLITSLGNQAERDAQAGGVAIPPASTDT
jgi:hypothetical protein